MTRPILYLLFVLSCLFASKISGGETLLLCGGPEVFEDKIVVLNGQVELKEVWHWRPEQSEGLPVPLMRKFITTDDCKPVSQGKEILITSSGDAVALVDHSSGKTLFYATVNNAHSADLLPGGLIAVASSSGSSERADRIMIFDRRQSEKPLSVLPLPAAHGVVWDSSRNVLWALGGKQLLVLRLDTSGPIPHLVTERTVLLPAPVGHDLQLADDYSALYVSNTKSVFRVDPAKMSFAMFEPFAGLGEIKSLSINPHSHQIAYTQADPGVWWTYTLRFINPIQQITLPSMVYKVRWRQ